MPSGPPSGMEDLLACSPAAWAAGAARRASGAANVVHRLKVGLEAMFIGSTRCAGRPVGSVGATTFVLGSCLAWVYSENATCPRL